MAHRHNVQVPSKKAYITRSSFRMYPLFRVQIILTLTAFALFGLVLWVISIVGSSGPGWLFTVAWTAVLALLAQRSFGKPSMNCTWMRMSYAGEQFCAREPPNSLISLRCGQPGMGSILS